MSDCEWELGALEQPCLQDSFGFLKEIEQITHLQIPIEQRRLLSSDQVMERSKLPACYRLSECSVIDKPADKLRIHVADTEISSGEFVCIIGPNGAGKSSLLHLLTGDLLPSKGSVTLDGINLNEWKAKKLAKRRAVLPQNSELKFPLLVEEVVSLGRTPHKRLLSKADARYEQDWLNWIFNSVDIDYLRDRKYDKLSGGEKQRVQLARVLAQFNSDSLWDSFLLLDEPSSALDLKHQYRLFNLIKNLNENHHLGIVVVMHDLTLCAEFADRILLLSNSGIAMDGDTRSVLNSEALSQVYGIDLNAAPHPQQVNKIIIATSAKDIKLPELPQRSKSITTHL